MSQPAAPVSVVIHGHFYQPPREDPWLEEVEAEPSAAPFHDWNQRIDQECYRAVVAARLPGPEGRIAGIINTLEYLSFNVGPTLLEWMEREAPETYQAILEADRASRERLGHGNAIAMPYHHAILPLSSRRDKITEIRWGIADFRRRFGREPEGLWLPETAVDHETLEVLAEAGIRFTILGGHQVIQPPPNGLPGCYRTRTGHELAVFLYDGPLSHGVAFGPLINNAETWTTELLRPAESSPEARIVSIATDGETYGHHHHFGEMALARVIERLRATDGVRVENFASLLARFPPRHPVELISPSSWSCPHGVERWRSECGCRIAPDRETQQRWRTPLRDAMNWLTAELHAVFEREGRSLFGDPWRARDAYGKVVGADPISIQALVRTHLHDGEDEAVRIRAGELLEMERGALRMLTSCAWFFDDLGGIETVQVLRYAARAIELAGPAGAGLDEGFGERLSPAQSNDRALGNGRDLYSRHAKPQISATVRIAAGLAAARRFKPAAATSVGFLLEARDGARVDLIHARTGRRTSLEVELHQQGLDLEAVVSGPGAPQPERLRLAHLPERQREALTLAFRARLIERWFAEPERVTLGRGESTLREVAHRALARATMTLEGERGDEGIQRVLEILELYKSLGLYAPFDVQTRFHRLWRALPAAESRRLMPVAQALGFASGAPTALGS